MLRSIAVLACLFAPVLAQATGAQAKTFKLGAEPAVAEITIPDNWDVDASDGGLEALAPEAKGAAPPGSAYISAEVFDTANIAAAGQVTAQFIREQKIKVNPKSQAKGQRKVAGLETSDVSWDATDEDGPTHLRISLVKLRPDRVLLLTYWRSDAGERTHAGEIGAIENSIKPLK